MSEIHEDNARLKKCYKVAKLLREHGVDHRTLQKVIEVDEYWSLVASTAGVLPLSERSRYMVCQLIEFMEEEAS